MSDFDSSCDVLIIGAGLSGINAGYRFQTQLPSLNYTILERRDNIGGTWSFFKYPGLRSDSDLHTFGFAWEPWETNSPIATAESIVTYVRHAAKKYGIDERVRFGWEVMEMDWRREEQKWVTGVRNVGTGEAKTVRARFVIASTGFFNYKEPRKTEIPGLDNFNGLVIHPQNWPEDLDYTEKRMAVIGSGATAITIVPVVAKKASKVTMIQRSPSYVHSIVTNNPVDNWLRAWFPKAWSSFLLRWKYELLTQGFFLFTQWYPEKAREFFSKSAKEQLPENIAWDPHFKPKYNVWDQRLCVCPDGDFYESLQSGKADVKTGSIRSVERDAVVMDSGERIEADIMVTATGLKLQMLGGAKLTVDGGEPIDIGDRFMWRGAMIEGVPNAMVVIGYFNNSWTRGADLATQIFITTIKNATAQGMNSFTPTIAPDIEKTMPVRPLWNMTSTYLKAGNITYPKASIAAPWAMKNDYMRDWWALKRNDLFTDMVFT